MNNISPNSQNNKKAKERQQFLDNEGSLSTKIKFTIDSDFVMTADVSKIIEASSLELTSE